MMRNQEYLIRIKDLEERIKNASILMADWDGYYDPSSKRGNAHQLAMLMEEAYTALQGKSWRTIKDGNQDDSGKSGSGPEAGDQEDRPAQ